MSVKEVNIIDYWPEVISEVKEFQEIAKAENPELISMWDSTNDVLADQFILTATENGIKRWEKLLGITPKASYTLEDRRFAVLARLNEQLPYTVRVFIQLLTQLCGEDGYVLTINHAYYKVDILVELKSKNMVTEVEALARKIIPANMDISIRIRYNQHYVLTQLTHQALSAFTHNTIRNEVIV